MARFYLHLVDGEDVLLDPEGVDVARSSLPERALKEARSILSADALGGCINLRQSIEVRDGNGEIVHAQPFADALTIIPATP